MNCTEVSIFKQTNKVRLCRLLQRRHGGALEPQIGLEVLGNFTNQSLERQLTDQKLGRLLILSDLTQSHSSMAKSVRLFHSAGGRRWPWWRVAFLEPCLRWTCEQFALYEPLGINYIKIN
ncbi:Uncharacterized protein Adt_03920 [Abeliophyllum distichum]|uniref:Uncharacterized protein n=1 Tax=Abeliophyllum distichum TaxID=126358 RepID=A0ABD1W041_9LAMI